MPVQTVSAHQAQLGDQLLIFYKPEYSESGISSRNCSFFTQNHLQKLSQQTHQSRLQKSNQYQ